MQTVCMRDLIAQRDLPVVLLIDDDMVSREVAATVLTLSGYTVYTADDGVSALKKLGGKGCNPAVILMDAQMPGLSGEELIRELRSRTNAMLIAISGSEVGDGILSAADGFLMKPFDAASLERVLQKQDLAPATKRAGKIGLDSNDPVVSPESLAQLRSLMPEKGIREIYSAVAADLEKRLVELETAIASKNAEAVRRIGHAIKGGCGMAGALQAARLGAMLEALPEDPVGNQFDNSAKILKDLRGAARNLERILTSELPV